MLLSFRKLKASFTQSKSEEGVPSFSFFLMSEQPHLTTCVDFQLWIANHDNPENSMHRGFEYTTDVAFTGACSHATTGLRKPYQAVCNHSLKNCFADHCNDAALSDVTVKAGDRQIRTHKVILAAQSPSFRAMFQSGMHEETLDTIELGGMEGPVLEALMSFLYGSLAKIPAELLLPLYVAADAHQVDSLRKVCVEQIMDDITLETVLTYAVTADSLSDVTLLEACLAFIKDPNNSVDVVQQPAMQQVLQHQPEVAHKVLLALALTNAEHK